MNPYTLVGSGIGTNDAVSLSARLSAWHDAMVAHERRLRAERTSDICDDECPHAEARALWGDAVATFGPRAHQLAFLRSHATEMARRSRAGAALSQSQSQAADKAGHRVTRERARREGASAVSPLTPAPPGGL